MRPTTAPPRGGRSCDATALRLQLITPSGFADRGGRLGGLLGCGAAKRCTARPVRPTPSTPSCAPHSSRPSRANLTFTEAVVVPLAGLTAWQALEKTPIGAGQRVLVTGASGGSATSSALQIAKARGAEVTAVCSGRNAEMVTGLGADHVIDYQPMRLHDARPALRRHRRRRRHPSAGRGTPRARAQGGVPVGRNLTGGRDRGGRAARPHARHRRCRDQVPDVPPAASGGRVGLSQTAGSSTSRH